MRRRRRAEKEAAGSHASLLVSLLDVGPRGSDSVRADSWQMQDLPLVKTERLNGKTGDKSTCFLRESERDLFFAEK